MAYNKYSVEKRKAEYLWRDLYMGQRDALDKLFRLFYSSLFNYGIKLVQEEEIVKDGIQDLFLKLWQRHETLSQARSVEAYLLYSLRRIVLRQVKKRNNRQEYNKAYLEETFSVSFTIEEILIRKEVESKKKETLLKAVNNLNSRQKETLFLRYYHGLTIEEIAGVMNINRQSVRNHLTRAIKSLRIAVQSPTLSGKRS